MLAHVEPKAVRDLELFAGLLDGEIKAILELCELEQVAAGETIYEPGKRRQALYILLEGELEVDLQVPGSSERVLLNLLPQESFGEVSFFLPGPHTATVRCVKNAQLLRLSRCEFDQLVQDGRGAAIKLAMNAAKILARRLAATDRWMGELLGKLETEEVTESWRKFRCGISLGQHPGGVSAHPGAW